MQRCESATADCLSPHDGCQGPTAPLPHGFLVCALAHALCQRPGGHVRQDAASAQCPLLPGDLAACTRDRCECMLHGHPAAHGQARMPRREVRCSDVEGCVGPACRLPEPHSTSAAWFPGVRARARALSAARGAMCQTRCSERAVPPAARRPAWLHQRPLWSMLHGTLQRTGRLECLGVRCAAAMWRVVWGPHAGCQGPTAPLPHGFLVCALARALCQRLGGPCETRYSERAVAPAARRPAWLHQQPL